MIIVRDVATSPMHNMPCALQESGIPVPTHIIIDRDGLAPNENPEGFVETEDYVEFRGELLLQCSPPTNGSGCPVNMGNGLGLPSCKCAFVNVVSAAYAESLSFESHPQLLRISCAAASGLCSACIIDVLHAPSFNLIYCHKDRRLWKCQLGWSTRAGQVWRGFQKQLGILPTTKTLAKRVLKHHRVSWCLQHVWRPHSRHVCSCTWSRCSIGWLSMVALDALPSSMVSEGTLASWLMLNTAAQQSRSCSWPLSLLNTDNRPCCV